MFFLFIDLFLKLDYEISYYNFCSIFVQNNFKVSEHLMVQHFFFKNSLDIK
jgi:hypothetical protein